MFAVVSYGFNHLKIKAFDPAELGINEFINSEVVSIELRQRYFHISTIPCFGAGKFWAVRNSGNQLHEVSEEIAQKLSHIRERSRTPIRTYSLPIFILILLMMIGAITIGLAIHKANKPAWSGQKLFENNIASMKQKLKDPARADYYIFDDSWHYPSVFKVDSFNSSSVFLVSYDSTSRKSRKPFYYARDLFPYLKNEAKAFQSFWISRAKLNTCIYSGEYKFSAKFKGSSLEEIDPLETFRITNICRTGTPDIISNHYSENTWQNTITVGIENNGMSFNIEKLVSAGDFIDWHIDDFAGNAEPLPYRVNFTHNFYIKGKVIEETEGRPVLYLSGTDSLGNACLFELKVSKEKKEVIVKKLR